MSIWKRLFGGTETEQPPQPQPSVSPKPTASPAPSASPPKPDGGGTVGFLLFDYGSMDSLYGQQAFAAIYEGMRSSRGKCIFHDGDDLRQLVPQLLAQADRKEPASAQTEMTKPGIYLVGLWSDDISNFQRVHAHLVAKQLPGYLGHLTLPQRRTPSEFSQQMLQWSLPASISLADGKVVSGTNKYGISRGEHDHALMLAAYRGDIDGVRKFLAQGGDVDYVDPCDRRSTALSYASSKGFTEIVKVLREAGAKK